MIRYFLILSLTNLINTLPDVKIIGGSDANITDFPYQVSLRYKGSHVCGGSILTDFYILTAAHCTDERNISDLTVRTGSSFVNRGGQISMVQQVYLHENYNKTGYQYDVAVWKLQSRLQFGNSTRSIRLASNRTIIETDHIDGVTSGWGSTTPNGQIASIQLQSVVLPYISLESCRTYYPKELTETMFCAGYLSGGKDTCQGDSGGAYVVNGILLGITSWGSTSCGAPNQPGVFTNITVLRDFVDNILKNQ